MTTDKAVYDPNSWKKVPSDIVEAATKLKHWAAEQGFKQWQIAGIGPIDAHNKDAALRDVQTLLSTQPILSKYHKQNGFQYNRYMDDHYDWVQKKHDFLETHATTIASVTKQEGK